MRGTVLFSRLKLEDFTPCLVVLTESELLWKHGISISVGDVNRLDLREIVCVISIDQLCQENLPAKMYKLLRKKLSQIQFITAHGFVVSSVARSERHKWRTQEQLFWCESADDASRWISTLNKRIKFANPTRPNRLLIFLNPTSGNKKADHIYDTVLEPVFHLAKIETELVVTCYRGHLTEYLLTHSLDNFDGILCVGGDGFFAESAQGLLLRERMRAKLPLFRGHLPTSPQVTSRIRVGIIPAGSTDTVVFSTHGTNDVLTAVLHIILGDDLAMDVAAIHSEEDGNFLRYTISMLGYGFHADLLRNDDKLRWMGPRRYDYSGLHAFLAHAVYQGEVTYLPSADRDSHVQDGVICSSGCSVCSVDQSSVFDSTSGTDSGLEVSEKSSGTSLFQRDDASNSSTAQKLEVCRKFSEPAKNEILSQLTQYKHLLSDNSLQVPVLEARSQKLSLSEARSQDFENMTDFGQPKIHRIPRSITTSPLVFSLPSWSTKGCPKGWKTVRGAFVAINAFLLSCRCARAPNGPSPSAHLGDGCIDLILIKECSRSRFLQFLVRTAATSNKPKHGISGGSSSPFELPFVTVERVCAFKFHEESFTPTMNTPENDLPPSSPWSQAIDKPRHMLQSDISKNHSKRSIWCADGELVHHENIAVYVHRQLLHIFARGPEHLVDEIGSSSLDKCTTDCNELFDAVVASVPNFSDSICAIPIPKRTNSSTSNTIMVSTRP